MSIFDAYPAGRGMVLLLFQCFHSHVWCHAVIPLAFDRRRYHEPPLLPLMVNVLGPEVLEQKVLGPKVLETTNDVFDPSGGTTFVCGVCRLQDYRLREETFQSFPKLLKLAGDSLSV